MAKAAAAKLTTPAPAQKLTKDLPGKLPSHEHVHAANCGHRSWVHGDHIDYEHDGHYHYVVDEKTYECSGPNAQVLPFKKDKKK